MKHKTSSPRVLIIDDNSEIHEDFRKILCHQMAVDDDFEALETLYGNSVSPQSSETHVDIDFATQGLEGYQKVKQSLADGKPYSLAFVDIRMPPGWDGIKTTKKLWELDPEIQVVICSAFSDYSWHEMASQLEHSDRFLVLKKPFESIEVRQLVAALHNRWFGARNDVLTGLLNRRAFLVHFQHQFELSNRDQFPISCALIDLDFFKRINDVHGHDVGDKALSAIGELLFSRCPKGDHVARYGGEEFCVLLKDADEATATRWAEKTLESIRNLELKIDEQTTLKLTASIGISQLNDCDQAPGDGIKRADEGLRFAKKSGRNRVCAYSKIATNKLGQGSVSRHHAFHGITACNIMKPVSAIDRTSTLALAAKTLIDENVASAPVVDDDGRLVGLVANSDLLPRILDDERFAQTMSHQVMQTSVIYFTEETALREIYDFLIRVAIPKVVIVRDQRPVGVITRSSLLKWLCSRGYSPAAATMTNLTQPSLDALTEL